MRGRLAEHHSGAHQMMGVGLPSKLCQPCRARSCIHHGRRVSLSRLASIVATLAPSAMAHPLPVAFVLALSLCSAQAFRIPFWSTPSTDNDWTQSGLQSPRFCNGLSCPKFKISEITSEYVVRQYANSETFSSLSCSRSQESLPAQALHRLQNFCSWPTLLTPLVWGSELCGHCC